ncbi:Aste57867_21156 [Aphanomyces stellatus]|uniref:Aste57867_21156 protein n=1 Tax=Aphanomyces stellatus TaxID=120398 RepID=A0A485LGT1_9STRA|nr:hypothetical protein As57867_021088 [Aphanomyces stellatus]VFT97830.1 Aste57867_21156 [Aphanomyces stellatus]
MRGVFLAALAAITPTLHGCSDFLLRTTGASSDQVVSARTMDFYLDLKTVVEIVPRDTEIQEPIVRGCPDCPDFAWRTKYGFVGLNSFGMNVAGDGLNEHGLSAASLWLTGSEYPPPATADTSRPIVSSLTTYLLGNFATVDQVKAALVAIQVAEADPALQALVAPFGGGTEDSYPLHYAVHDAKGQSIAIEVLNGTIHVYDNPNGVLTNEPPFEQQLALVAAHDKAVGTGDKVFAGGYTPIERFQRLTFLNRHANAHFLAKTSYSTAAPDQAAIATAVHLINTVTIPTAYVDNDGATQYAVVRDHTHRRLFFLANENQLLRSIDLTQIDFATASNRKALSVTFGDWHVDMTAVALASTDRSADMPPRSVVQGLLHGGAIQSIDASSKAAVSNGSSFWMGLAAGIVGSVVVVNIVLLRMHRRFGRDEYVPLL